MEFFLITPLDDKIDTILKKKPRICSFKIEIINYSYLFYHLTK